MSTCIECVVPESLGLSSARLGRISAYLKDYVESGKLPGYLVVVSRRGQPVYLDRHGWRDVEARAPVEDMSVLFLTQLMPSSSYPIRRDLRVLSYQALVD